VLRWMPGFDWLASMPNLLISLSLLFDWSFY
jgi:hypothetical protein